MQEAEKIIGKCRVLNADDNERDMDHWIVERGTSKSDGFYSSAIKCGSTHMVLSQNGSIESWVSPRRRVGLWNFDTQHLSSLDIEVDGRNEKDTFVKYVRGYGYIYRQYENFERLDFISHGKAIMEMELRSETKSKFEIRLDILHETAWPQSNIADTYELNIKENCIEAKSNIASTLVYYRSDGKAEIIAESNKICIKSDSASTMGIYISCDGSSPEAKDLDDSVKYNEKPNGISKLTTPSFRINKLFKWAKHDLLELFTSSPIGNGFYAGIPQFSWFFGRDGEWMSMAAMECGMGELAKGHLDMLYSFSKKGRIPHEIPLSNGGSIVGRNFSIGDARISTQFMSIDSSPLWVICNYMLSGWTEEKLDRNRIGEVMEFCRSCDRDHDGLLENRFSEGLIGWPESWAQKRDGICVDVNAWWLEALRLFLTHEKKNMVDFDHSVESFRRIFYSDQEQNITVPDSVNGKEQRDIKGAMQIVPAMYFSDFSVKKSLEWLYKPDMVTEWGVRSVSNRDKFYDGGYHTGTVWPLMSGWMALALYNNSMHVEGFNIIETFTKLGFSSLDPGRINETYNSEFLYGEGQFFQGWSSSLFIQSLMEGMLGFKRVPAEGDPSISMNPHLPEGWNEIKLLDFPFRGKKYNISVNPENKIEVESVPEELSGKA